jgi:hypothetical protein
MHGDRRPGLHRAEMHARRQACLAHYRSRRKIQGMTLKWLAIALIGGGAITTLAAVRTNGQTAYQSGLFMLALLGMLAIIAGIIILLIEVLIAI